MAVPKKSTPTKAKVPAKKPAVKKATAAPKRAPWRPTKYKTEYCQAIVDYFDVEPYEEIGRRTTDPKSGREYVSYEDSPADLPTIEGFAAKICVNPDTLVEWAKVHKDFSAAYTYAKALQKHILIVNGLRGLYPSNFAIFVGTNLTDLRSKTESDVTVRTEEPLLGGDTQLDPDDVPTDDSTAEDQASS